MGGKVVGLNPIGREVKERLVPSNTQLGSGMEIQMIKVCSLFLI